MATVRESDGDVDPFQLKIAAAYAGTVFLDVWSVSAKWNDCTNRDLDYDHVKKLASVFEAGIHRVDESKRLKASVTIAEWDEVLHYLSQLMNEHAIPTPVSLPVDTSSLAAIAKEKNRIISHLDHTALIFPRDIPITPILEAGQHRAAALESMMGRRTVFSQTPEGRMKNMLPAKDEVRAVSKYFGITLT